MQDEPRSNEPQSGEGEEPGGPNWSPKAAPDLNIILRGGELAPEQQPDDYTVQEQPPARPQGRIGVHYVDDEPLARRDPEAAAASAPEFEIAPRVSALPVIIGLGVVLLIVVGFFTLPTLLGKKDEAAGTSAPGSTLAGGTAQSTAPVGLEPYAIDDVFHEKLAEALALGNSKSTPAGYYAYRYNLLEKTERGSSQTLTITAYLGGAGADAAAKEGGGREFRDAVQPYMNNLNAREGVTATLLLRSTGGTEAPADDDRWLLYGIDYYRENQKRIQEVVAAIDGYRNSTGQYPSSLLTAAPDVKTKGNPSFEAGGYGYLPLFRTDSSGNIQMGSGTGVASYTPAEVTGYYLFVYLRDPALGQDVMSPEDLQYYIDKISPFPYKPAEPVKNMPLTPDGKPDGVAVVIKNGKPVE